MKYTGPHENNFITARGYSRQARSESLASKLKRSAVAPNVKPLPSGPPYVFRCLAIVVSIRSGELLSYLCCMPSHGGP